MHVHILGICGTFMGSLAMLAREMGLQVTGSDQNVYPPMSTQLENAGIVIHQGFDEAQFAKRPDMVIVGNAMSRGNPAVEYVLNNNLPYTSGPQWLADNVLKGRWVLGVAGTHGKTTTTSMLAWILECCGFEPGFLIGGVAQNFGVSAKLGNSDFFVIEADEYDSAFFDKRSKFVHYKSRTLILNNLEFDHADIFADLAAIQTQFHHVIRTVPSQGLIIHADQPSLHETLKKGCWSETQMLGRDWQAVNVQPGHGQFDVLFNGEPVGQVSWSLQGEHNMQNALAAIAAARHVGVQPGHGIEALNRFAGVKRRMECVGDVKGIKVYDDFAHHPTAIKTTLEGARAKHATGKLWAVIEPRSNTMRMGVHRDALAQSTTDADEVIWYQPKGLNWDLGPVIAASPKPASTFDDIAAIIAHLVEKAAPGDAIVIMSNGGFAGIHGKLVQALEHA